MIVKFLNLSLYFFFIEVSIQIFYACVIFILSFVGFFAVKKYYLRKKSGVLEKKFISEACVWLFFLFSFHIWIWKWDIIDPEIN